jgi:endoglucanase
MRASDGRIRILRRTAGAVLALGLLLGGSQPSHAASLPAISVSGNKLVAGGAEIVLRGVNALDPLAMNRYMGHWEDDYFAQMATWGSKVVRLPVHPSEWSNRFYNGRGSCGFPQVYQQCKDKMAVIEQAVAWAGDHGMYSIIDWHVIGSLVTGYFQGSVYRTDQAQTEDFWRQIATRFKDDPRVAAYELLNEPVTDRNGWQVSEAQWLAQRDWFDNLVRVIRAIDPNKPIICNGLDWGYNLVYAGTNPVSDPAASIIYGVHPYPVKSLPWDTYFGNLKATYPVLATEFGFQNNGSSVYDENAYQGGTSYRSDLDAYLDGKGIGWMAWSFGPLWEPILTLDWNYTPSEQGQFYKDRLLAAGGGHVPDGGVAPPDGGVVPPDGGVAHVAAITMSFQPTGKNYKAIATVAIADATGRPVSSATVQGLFTDATTDSVSALTGSDGQATLTSSGKRGGGNWSFRVENVVRASWAYDAAANLVTCATITAP